MESTGTELNSLCSFSKCRVNLLKKPGVEPKSGSAVYAYIILNYGVTIRSAKSNLMLVPFGQCFQAVGMKSIW